MSKVRRAGYVFLAWIGDHGPRHVHVYRRQRLVCKWDLDRGVAMKGKASRKVRKLICQLEQEGRF